MPTPGTIYYLTLPGGAYPAGATVTKSTPVWSTTKNAAAGTGVVLPDGALACCDQNYLFDPALATLGDSSPARPKSGPGTFSATGGGATGGLLRAGSYRVAITWVDDQGLESVESQPIGNGTSALTVAAGNIPAVSSFPAVPHPGIVGMHLYLTDATGAYNTLRRYTTSAIAVTYGTAVGAQTLATDYSLASALPPNGAVRLTYVSSSTVTSKLVPSGPYTLHGDVMDSRVGTGTTTAQYVVDHNGADTAVGTFDPASARFPNDTIYGVHFGGSAAFGGMRFVGSVRASPWIAGNRPGLTAAGEYNWKQAAPASAPGVSSGHLFGSDAELSGYSDVPLSKAIGQGGLPTPPAILTAAIAPSGGGTTGGLLPFDSANRDRRFYAAIAWVDANGNESARSPWSDPIGDPATATLGWIPRLTLPTIPAGVAYVHVYVRPNWVEPGDPSVRYRSYVAVTPGSTTTTVDLTAALPTSGAGQTTAGLFVSQWTGGVSVELHRCRMHRAGRIGMGGNLTSGDRWIDDDTLWYDLADCPYVPLAFGTIGTAANKAITGSFHDTLYQTAIATPTGAIIGTMTKPAYLGNWYPGVVGNTVATSASRAWHRTSKTFGAVWPGDLSHWHTFVDGSTDWESAYRTATNAVRPPAYSTRNWHGYNHNLGLTAQQFTNNFFYSFGTDGVGDILIGNGSPTGIASWGMTYNFQGPDMGHSLRRCGDLSFIGGDAPTNNNRNTVTHNSFYTGDLTYGEGDAIHFDEATGTNADQFQDLSYNLAWVDPAVTTNGSVGMLMNDFHFVAGGVVAPGVVRHADYNAGWGLRNSTNISSSIGGGATTSTVAGLGYNARDQIFADAGGVAYTPDQRGGSGPLRADPQMRYPYASPLTMMWRWYRANPTWYGATGSYAVGATRPSGAIVYDGSVVANTSTAMALDVNTELRAWLKSLWWYKANTGSQIVTPEGTFDHILDAIEAYIAACYAPTNPLYAPSANGGATPGAFAYVAAQASLTLRRSRMNALSRVGSRGLATF